MSSHTKKQHKAARPSEPALKKETAIASQSFQKNFPFIITGIFFLLSYIGISNHEMWRDELQAWLVGLSAAVGQ